MGRVMLYNIIRFLFPLFTIIFNQELNSNELYQFENKSLQGVSLKSSDNETDINSDEMNKHSGFEVHAF